MSDKKVKEAQEWYNETYAGKNGYVSIEADGIAGVGTCKAFVRALQIELGLSGVDGIMGTGTLNACPTISAATENENLVKIIQCGFYCKGYECGGITGTYGKNTKSAATKFRSDVGFDENDGSMPPKFIKALLNTDPYTMAKWGNPYVQEAQKTLNRSYIIHMPNISFVPCNGVPDRNMMKGILAALQYEEAGHTLSGVDGIYGNGTLSKAPTLEKGSTKTAYIKIAQMCMMCMNKTKPALTGVFDEAFENAIKSFQEFHCLTYDSRVSPGVIDRYTWASLLSSKGENTRKARACDCSEQILTAAKAKYLKQNYDFVGRYLTGTVGGTKDKSLSLEEIEILTAENLNIFPIYQDGGNSENYFGEARGKSDAGKAITAAENLHIPYGTIIYFCVDYDFTAEKITDKVVPYFKGINEVFNSTNSGYRIGVYGSRNICSTICEEGLACSSFVSDMSSGYSGNLGFPLPDNWAFDQFYEYTATASDGSVFNVDKDAFSGRDYGFKGGTYCGGENYKDVTKHRMVLNEDGYYVCKACGYRVRSPFAQDKDILSTDDYMKVYGLACAYAFLINNSNYAFLFYDFWWKMNEIRNQEQYVGKYEYCDESGKCVLIEPEVENTGLALTSNTVQDNITITSANINYYNGVFNTILETITEFLFGVAIPTDLGTDIALAIDEYVKKGNIVDSFYAVVQALADAAGVKEWKLILDLLKIGVDLTEAQKNTEIQAGDILIRYANVTAPSFELYIVLDSNGKFKTCYRGDKNI